MKYFNTAGPIRKDDHYYIPLANRIDVDEILLRIEQKKYFVLHAPRQSGKTSSLLELMELLNKSGKYKCLYVNVEGAQAARENVDAALKAIVSELEFREGFHLKESIIKDNAHRAFEKEPYYALANILGEWAKSSSLPTILFIDEIDSLVGDTLVAVLRQLRSRYDLRPDGFPQSIILCGVRDVRDYRINASREKEIITGGSCFNINAESMRVGNFNENDVRNLYLQHTKETGQEFTEEALKLAYELTSGQPWLVNALAYEACFELTQGKDRSNAITADMISTAKENLIQRRVTHLDQLVDKLQEDRVHRIIAPILEGTSLVEFPPDDLQYVIDLGLVHRVKGKIDIANLIYKEVIPRELSFVAQTGLGSVVEPQWFVNEDGGLNMEKLLTSFQQFYRENSESWTERYKYKEYGPQLLLMAFLQRVVNGGGSILREYGLGNTRTDLLVVWRDKTKHVLELKILHKGLAATKKEGMVQTFGYMDKAGVDIGHLLIFDRNKGKSWSKKIFRQQEAYAGKTIVIWGM